MKGEKDVHNYVLSRNTEEIHWGYCDTGSGDSYKNNPISQKIGKILNAVCNALSTGMLM